MSTGTALTISPSKFNDALEEVEKWKKKYNGMQQAGEAKAGLVVAGVSIVVTEGALGYARGRYGEKQFGGLPAEFWGGAVAELAALSGFFGKHSEVVAGVGHGALGFCAAIEMMKAGEAARAKAESPKAQPQPQVVQTQGQVVDESTQPVQAARRSGGSLPQKRVVATVPNRTMADDVVEVPKSGT
jgi:hypothetical protein